MKTIKIGDNVKYTFNTRVLKKGFTEDEVSAELRKGTVTDFSLAEIMKKYYAKKRKIITGTSVVKSIERISTKTFPDLLLYHFEDGEHTTIENLEYIPFHKGFYEILNEIKERQSILTRTGILYSYNDIVIMELVKSTRNLWIDASISEHILTADKIAIEKEIRRFFGSVNNINYGLDINRHIEEKQELFDKMINLFKNATADENKP